jgi:5-methylcytosine-specific restriction endonuclease McrA
MSSTKQLHKQWRKEFREGVFKRDNYKCRVCGETGLLDAHHITDRHNLPNGGYVLSNGVSLCSKCHVLAGEHVIGGRTYPPAYEPEFFYSMIGSSFEQALTDSRNLLADFPVV